MSLIDGAAFLQLPASPRLEEGAGPDDLAHYREQYAKAAHWCHGVLGDNIGLDLNYYCYIEVPTPLGIRTASDGVCIIRTALGEFMLSPITSDER